MKTSRFTLVGWLAFAGCADVTSLQGNARLGIERFDARETTSSVSIIGLDATGAVAGQVDLHVGMVDVPHLGETTFGREIVVRVGPSESQFATGGRQPLFLPAPPQPQLAELVLDPYVGSVLRRWGVTYAALDDWLDGSAMPDGEAAYTACYQPAGACATCADYTAPCQGAGARNSCEDWSGYYLGYPQWQQLVQCNNDLRAIRTCTAPSSPSQCGSTGPNGCAPCGPAWQGPTNGNITCSGSCTWVDAPSGGGGGGGCSNSSCSSPAECCSGYCESGQCLVEPI